MTSSLSSSDDVAERTNRIASWLIAGAALVLVLLLRLLPALLAGMLVYELVETAAPRLRIGRIRGRQAKLVAIALLTLGVVGLIAGVIAGLVAFAHSESGSVPTLLQKMADVIESWRTTLPPSIVQQLPEDVDEIRETIVPWLRQHAGTLQHVGTEGGRVLAHMLVGAAIGALAALHDPGPRDAIGPLARALQTRATLLGVAFRRVVFGQLRISAINTIFTALYLLVGLRVAGVHLPLAKTMIVLTFLVGLLPVVGNLVSNTAIVVLSLSVSPSVGIASLVFLVVIHKFEYFLNAHIVGTQVRAHAWELLLAMLAMEAAFGVPGLIAAPVYYAYVKGELVKEGLV